MRFKSIISILLAASTIALLQSCHIESDTSDSDPYLDGNLSFDMPLFVTAGEELTLIPKGASNPTTGDVGYFWFSSWTGARDTTKTETGPGDGAWVVSMPEKTGTYTISATAYATDYYSLSVSKAFTVVDPSLDGTLKGAGYQVDSVTFTDPRDGGRYFLATSGGNLWMQNNLYYNGSGISYESSSAMDQIVGRMYNWNEAVAACPEGWHLPSDAEFASLAGIKETIVGETLPDAAGSIMADVTFNDERMWTFWPDVKITNTSKFSALPIGYGIDQEDVHKFTGTNAYAVFWTSNELDEETGVYRYVYMDKNNIYASYGDKESFRASVRCVKD